MDLFGDDGRLVDIVGDIFMVDVMVSDLRCMGPQRPFFDVQRRPSATGPNRAVR